VPGTGPRLRRGFVALENSASQLELMSVVGILETETPPKERVAFPSPVPGTLRLVLASLGLAQGIILDARKGREIRDPLGCPEQERTMLRTPR
jgi:hypothetical protein